MSNIQSSYNGEFLFCQVSTKERPDRQWREESTRYLKSNTGINLDEEVGLSKYGGFLGAKEKASGYFRAEKIDGRWWIIDPEGYRFMHIGIVSLAPGKSNNNKEAFAKKFRDERHWTEETVGILREHGFNGAGAWSSVDLIRNASRPLAYTCIWNFMSSYGKKRGGTYTQPGHTGYPNDCIFVFEPQFEEFCDMHARQIAEYKDDKYLLGHFSDNELPFPNNLLDKYLSLDKENYGYKAARQWLDARKGENAGLEAVDNTDREEFVAFVIDRYLEITGKAIRKYDPNHMFLGSRFYSDELRNPAAFRAAGKHLDAISLNYYNVWTPVSETMANWEKWSGKPFIVTEWYTKGEDSGLPNNSGAGWIVKTQRDKGLFYQNYALALLESKACVGWHYFKYMDNDPEDLTTDPSNRDSNKGIATIRYEYYKDFMELMKPFNKRVYSIISLIDKK